MKYYFAPLEGITDSIYRQLHHKYFPGLDRYYTPFFSPTVHRALTPKESRELPFADAIDYNAVPQLLTKVADDFLWMAEQCADRGYTEVNLNLGCPSGTVTAKGKGSGMLRDTDALDRFLDAIFRASPLPISIKTRIGFSSADEFPSLLDIFNHYPVKELTVHPRIRTVFYSGDVDVDAFRFAVENSRNPLCYNGDICALSQVDNIAECFPGVDSVMIGRGLIGDPGMVTNSTTPQLLEAFTGELLEHYVEAFGGARNAMFRMKEHWRYLICKFDQVDKLAKQLRKTTDIAEFKTITHRILQECPMRDTRLPF